MASGIPDHEVAGLGALGHLPVVYGATGGDPGCQFGDVLRVLIHLKYVNFNQGAFQVSEDRLPPATRWPAGHPVTPAARPGMTHRDGQSMRRWTKSTHIADY